VEYGADPNAATEIGLTPLHHVIKQSRDFGEQTQAVVAKLVKLGANVNVLQDLEGCTVLHHLVWRVSRHNKEAVLTLITKLVEFGANLNAQDKNGATALHKVLVDRFLQNHSGAILAAATKLVELGADTRALDSKGCTVLHYLTRWRGSLCYSGSKEMLALSITMLVENGADPNAADETGLTAWHQVIRRRDCGKQTHAMVTKLLELGADAGARDNEGCTALHHFVMGLHPYNSARALTLIAKLVEFGADPTNAQDKTGLTALHKFMIVHDEEEAKSLTVPYDYGEEMLEVVTKVLELGANPNMISQTGQTVLHALAKKTKKQKMRRIKMWVMVAVLFQEYGANPTIEDNEGCLPLCYSCDPKTFHPTAVFLWIQHMVGAGF